MSTTSSTTDVQAGQQCPVDLPAATETTKLSPLIEKYELALLMILGFAGFSLIVGLVYQALRRYVFRDVHSLDTVFDAGGKVSLSLTAVTVTSQMIWPADFLQSPTMASKVGVGGSLWYSLAIILSVLMFPVLCIQLKTRAPGAKTFPQIAYARFGKATHILFCCVALFTNMVITANLILAGKAAADVLAKDYSNEFIVLILAFLFGSYCVVGGLGTTFYISYFNTALIFITATFFILNFTYLSEPEVEEVTSMKSVHEAMACLKGPDGNYNQSFLTFRTESGLIYGFVTLFMTIAIIFCDQANWQSRIAAKPRDGIIGFFIAGFLWFAIPTPVSFVNSMTYKTLSFRNGTNLLTNEQIDQGYITPFIIQTLLGREGCFMLLTLMSMTLMSTGSGEVMSVSSVLVYDILKTHIRPFRPNLRPTDCPLCTKSKIPLSVDGKEPEEMCACPSATDCETCKTDKQPGKHGKFVYNIQYECKTHGEYRHYEELLLQYKNWCMVCVTICIVPFGLLVLESGMNLNWAFMAAQVFIAPFLVPLYMTIAWARATGSGLIAGGIVGLAAAITGMFTYATRYEGGLSKFYENTAQDWSILTGLLSGTITSTVVAVAVSLYTGYCRRVTVKKSRTVKKIYKIADAHAYDLDEIPKSLENDTQLKAEHLKCETSMDRDDLEWCKTMSIDSPLNPYRALYQEELAGINAGRVVTSKHMEKIFRRLRLVSFTGAAVSFLVFLVVIPAVALSAEVLTESQLGTWVSVCQHWCLVGTVFVVLVPPIQEGIQIYRQYKRNKEEKVNKC